MFCLLQQDGQLCGLRLSVILIDSMLTFNVCVNYFGTTKQTHDKIIKQTKNKPNKKNQILKKGKVIATQIRIQILQMIQPK